MTQQLRELVLLIPADTRKQLLVEEVIYKAIATEYDRHMQILFIVWTHYIDPGTPLSMNCPYCLNDMLKNFRGLQDALVELDREESLLDNL